MNGSSSEVAELTEAAQVVEAAEVAEALEAAEVAVPDPTPMFAARVGICLLNHPHNSDLKEAYGKIYEAFERDSRIVAFQAASIDDVVLSDESFSASGTRRGEKEEVDPRRLPLNPDRHIHVCRVNPPVRLHVKVPRRVQAAGGNDINEVPTDEYWAIWDGITIAVLWRYGDSTKPFGQGAGRVVLQIVREAARKATAQALIEPCGPNCDFPFAHARLFLRSVEDEVEVPFVHAGTKDVNVLVPGMTKAEDGLRYLFAELSFVGFCFATMRSHGATIQEVANRARSDLTELLKVYYMAVSRRFSFRRLATFSWWRDFKWRRGASRLIASLWLAVATIETQKLEWSNVKFVYDDSASHNGTALVFKSEYLQDANVIEHIDVSGVKAAVEHASSRIDTRSLVIATTVAAIVGALVGAIVGAIVSTLA
jgi:hypothetical protein